MTSRSVFLSLSMAMILGASSCSISASSEREASPDLTWPNQLTETTLASDPVEPESDDETRTDETQTDEAPADESAETAAPPSSVPFSVDGERPNVSLDVEQIVVTIDDVFDEGHSIALWAPVGWEQSDFFGITFEPPESGGLGFFTEFSVDNGCNGICESQDWWSNLTSDDGPIGMARQNNPDAIVRDEAIGENAWIIVSDDGFDDGYEIDVYRWDDDSDFYFHCSATTGVSDQAMLDDLAVICATAVPNWIG